MKRPEGTDKKLTIYRVPQLFLYHWRNNPLVLQSSSLCNKQVYKGIAAKFQ